MSYCYWKNREHREDGVVNWFEVVNRYVVWGKGGEPVWLGRKGPCMGREKSGGREEWTPERERLDTISHVTYLVHVNLNTHGHDAASVRRPNDPDPGPCPTPALHPERG